MDSCRQHPRAPPSGTKFARERKRERERGRERKEERVREAEIEGEEREREKNDHTTNGCSWTTSTRRNNF